MLNVVIPDRDECSVSTQSQSRELQPWTEYNKSAQGMREATGGKGHNFNS